MSDGKETFYFGNIYAVLYTTRRLNNDFVDV